MKPLFYAIHRTIMNTMERAGYPLRKAVSIREMSKSCYYAQLSYSPKLDF